MRIRYGRRQVIYLYENTFNPGVVFVQKVFVCCILLFAAFGYIVYGHLEILFEQIPFQYDLFLVSLQQHVAEKSSSLIREYYAGEERHSSKSKLVLRVSIGKWRLRRNDSSVGRAYLHMSCSRCIASKRSSEFLAAAARSSCFTTAGHHGRSHGNITRAILVSPSVCGSKGNK